MSLSSTIPSSCSSRSAETISSSASYATWTYYYFWPYYSAGNFEFSIKWNLSIELAAVIMSLTWRVFLFCTLAIWAQTPAKSCTKNSVALLISSNASLVTIPHSGSVLMIWRTLLRGNYMNFPKGKVRLREEDLLRISASSSSAPGCWPCSYWYSL